jgi:ubiquinone/menaquinone biosynthesis C-methylase UbiE
VSSISIEPSKRIADDDIYIGEDRRGDPRQTHLRIAELLSEAGMPGGAELLDIGCATGDLLHHLACHFPQWRLFGLDVSETMIGIARSRVPKARFQCGSAEQGSLFESGRFDAVVMSGVLNCFDEIDQILASLVDWTRAGGTVILADMLNPHPIDVVMRHRRVKDSGWGPWELGWNYWSERTLNALLTANPRVSETRVEWFHMPFPLPKSEDPMRTWTISTSEQRLQTVNGAQQLINFCFFVIRVT